MAFPFPRLNEWLTSFLSIISSPKWMAFSPKFLRPIEWHFSLNSLRPIGWHFSQIPPAYSMAFFPVFPPLFLRRCMAFFLRLSMAFFLRYSYAFIWLFPIILMSKVWYFPVDSCTWHFMHVSRFIFQLRKWILVQLFLVALNVALNWENPFPFWLSF